MNNDLISRSALKENGTVIAIVNGEKMKVVPVKFIDNAPTVEQDALITEIIEELESRKDYGAEYAQAMEDVIVILKAKFGLGEEE